MIRVTIELVPGGRGKPQHLGTMLISNQSRLASVSDYLVRFRGKLGGPLKREALVRGHRREKEPVWSLVRKALREAGY